jgi:hypothetical protein
VVFPSRDAPGLITDVLAFKKEYIKGAPRLRTLCRIAIVCAALRVQRQRHGSGDHLSETTTRVPERYLGVWQRLILQTDMQPCDITSQVFWLQTTTWHADIRVPQPRPDFSGTTGLQQCGREQLEWLAAQQGFVGVTHVQDGTCQWQRHADYQPPTGLRDIGQMVFLRPDLAVETGVESRYLEVWQKLPDSTGATAVLQRLADGVEQSEWFLVSGQYFMHVRARSEALDAAANLLSLARREGAGDDRLRRLLDFEISFGRRGAHAWRIQRSTLPFLEGATALNPHELSAPAQGVVQLGGEHPTQWRALEWTLRTRRKPR